MKDLRHDVLMFAFRTDVKKNVINNIDICTWQVARLNREAKKEL